MLGENFTLIVDSSEYSTMTSCFVYTLDYELNDYQHVLLFFYSLYNNNITDEAVGSLVELLETLKDLKKLK
jgi:hypothetical protein